MRVGFLLKTLDSYSVLCDKSRAKRVLPTRRQTLTKTDKGTIDMAEKPVITPELLRQLLRYEPEAGKLFWKERPRELFKSLTQYKTWNTRFANKEAFGISAHQYRAGMILGTRVLAHRVAWAIYYDAWPIGDIDHINHNRSDNRIINLRNVDRKTNGKNLSISLRNKTGFIGVHKTIYNTFVASIKVNRKNIYLGSFKYLEEAIKARLSANEQYGFHVNHGAFNG